MTSFSGVIRLAAEPGATILADMDVFEDRLVVSAAGAEIGSWSRDDLSLMATSSGFSFVAEGEEIILEPSDLSGFAGAMGMDAASLPPQQVSEDVSEPHLDRPEPGALSHAMADGDVDPGWVHEQARTFGSLRQRSAAEWHESDTIDRPVLYVIGLTIFLTILGAVFGWGDGNLFTDSFPVEKVVFGLIAIAMVAALYMAITENQERQVVGLTVIGAGVFGLLMLWLWGRSTGVAFGYLVGAVAATLAIVGGFLAAADWPWVAFPHKEEPEQPPKKKKRSLVKRLLRRN